VVQRGCGSRGRRHPHSVLARAARCRRATDETAMHGIGAARARRRAARRRARPGAAAPPIGGRRRAASAADDARDAWTAWQPPAPWPPRRAAFARAGRGARHHPTPSARPRAGHGRPDGGARARETPSRLGAAPRRPPLPRPPPPRPDRAPLARDVQVDDLALVVDHGGGRCCKGGGARGVSRQTLDAPPLPPAPRRAPRLAPRAPVATRSRSVTSSPRGVLPPQWRPPTPPHPRSPAPPSSPAAMSASCLALT